MENLRLEEVSFGSLKHVECGTDAKKKKIYGIKRHVKLQFNKLNNSLEKNGWVFPIFVAELPNKDRYLIDGYARWENEDPKMSTGSSLGVSLKHPALIIQARDLDHVNELYLQCQSSYGTPTWDDFRNMKEENEDKVMSDYEIPGLVHPNFDLSIETRESLAEKLLNSKYQII